jgi:hypothetical protein
VTNITTITFLSFPQPEVKKARGVTLIGALFSLLVEESRGYDLYCDGSWQEHAVPDAEISRIIPETSTKLYEYFHKFNLSSQRETKLLVNLNIQFLTALMLELYF